MKPKSRSSDSWNISESKRLSTSLKSKSQNDTSDKIAIKTKSPIADHLLSMARSIKKLKNKKILDVSSPSSLKLRRSSDKVGLNSRKLPRQKAVSTLSKNKIVNISESAKVQNLTVKDENQLLGDSCEGSNLSVSSFGSSALDASRLSKRVQGSKTSSLIASAPMTPRIMVSKCEKLERLVGNDPGKGKKVLRAMIRSPVNKKSTLDRNRNKDKIEAFEANLKKKESEILSLNRKVNNLQKTVSEKERTIKGLELKFPKMISDLKQGLKEEKKMNVELKEVLKKYNQVSGDKKQMADQLKAKDDKLREVRNLKRNLAEELKCKELELSEFRQRLFALEEKVPLLVKEINEKNEEIKSKDEDIIRYEETVEFLEQRLEAQSEDQRSQEKLIDDLKRRLNACNEEIDSKENEIWDLRTSNYELYDELQEQYAALEATDQETKNYLQIIDSIREKIDLAPVSAEKLHNSIDYLDKATEDFLDKVSTVSKKKNMSFRVKLTISKGNRGRLVTGDQTFDSIILNQKSFNNNNSSRFSFNNIKHSSRNSGKFSQENIFKMSNSRNSSFFQNRNSIDEVGKNSMFNDNTEGLDEVFHDNEALRSLRKAGSSHGSLIESSVNTEASKSEYDVSSDTCNRLEELDVKVKTLWNKLSAKDDSYEAFKSNAKPNFTSSVSKIRNEMRESIDHQNRLINQVKVAKQLFTSPAARAGQR